MDGITERTEQPPLQERILDQVCSYRPQLYYMFVLEIVLLFIMLFSALYVEPGTASYVVLQIDFIILGTTLVPIFLILYMCSRREQA